MGTVAVQLFKRKVLQTIHLDLLLCMVTKMLHLRWVIDECFALETSLSIQSNHHHVLIALCISLNGTINFQFLQFMGEEILNKDLADTAGNEEWIYCNCNSLPVVIKH